MKNNVDLDQTLRFLNLLAESTPVTYQTYDDKKKDDKQKDKKLAQIIHEQKIERKEALQVLLRLNQQGAAACWMVNEGDGKERKAENVVRVRSVFIDLDKDGKEKLKKVQDDSFPPHAIIETSSGKYQVYWKGEIPLAEFTSIQEALIKKFGGDKDIKDIPRVMRLPGFFHQKGEPFLSHIISINEILAPYSSNDLRKLAELDGAKPEAKDRKTPQAEWDKIILEGVEDGHRHNTMNRLVGLLVSKRLSDAMILILMRDWDSRNTPTLESEEPKVFEVCLQNIRKAEAKKYPAPVKIEFPTGSIKGLAAEFADLYSMYLESPWTFFVFDFLTCLGNIISDRITLESEIAPQPRLNTITLGESADDRKSEAIKKTISFFDKAIVKGEFKICHGVGSAEGLARKLSEKEKGPKRLLLVYDELKSFVSKASIEGATLLPAVNTLFESNKYHTAVKTHSIEIDDAYLSLLGASTLETFSRMWTPAFLDIGFLNRLWLVKDHGERRFSIPREIPTAEINKLQKKLGKLLRKYAHVTKLPISDDARQVFDKWYLSLERSPLTKRLDAYGLRLMILLTVNEMKLEVTRETAQNVVDLLRWQLAVRREVDPIDAEGSIAKMEELIRRALANGPLPKRELQHKTHYTRVGIFAWNAAIQNLIGAGEILFKDNMYHLLM